MTSYVELTEAVGYGPESETTVDATICLVAKDVHSDSQDPLQRQASGLPTYSCERWLRLKFTGDDPLVQTIRFWIDNLDPSAGWSLLFGVSDSYQKPSLNRSGIATTPIPISDPGQDAPNVFPTPGVTGWALGQDVDQYSPWLVLQAVWDADVSAPFQTDDLNLNFAWSES